MTHFNLPASLIVHGFKWTGDRIPYPEPEIKGDTFPMTWAADGEIYASAGDPIWGETCTGLDIERFSGRPPDYKITKINPMNDYVGGGGDGPKPSGMICVDGILYLAFQNLRKAVKSPFSLRSQHGDDAQIIYHLGGFGEPLDFKTKGDPIVYGTWTPALGNISEPMFPGHKFGGPAFINFGQNNENARDRYVYAVSSDQWDNGSNLRLGRVDKDSVLRREAWEWVCAFTPSGNPAWVHDLNEAIPILSLYQWLGLPEMLYLASIQRYLLLTWHLHQDASPEEGSDLVILESPEPWGPFSLVHCEENWESKAFTPYCPRLPLKWMESDGISGWLQYSGSWSASVEKELYYRSNVRPFQLILK